MKHLKIISVTPAGYALAQNVKKSLPGYCTELYGRGADPSLSHSIFSRMVQQAMYDCDGIVFICAAGIAVRLIAPYLRGKDEDPAVVVMDEMGKHAVALLSGHLGGANALAHEAAEAVGAQSVITTATDLNDVFAVDTWAKARGYRVLEPENIRYISAAFLAGSPVGFLSDYPVTGSLPQGIVQDTGVCKAGFVVSSRYADKPFAHTLHIIPKSVVLGIGCRRGIAFEALEHAVLEQLEEAGISMQALYAAATIDIKKAEGAILQFCAKYGLPLWVYSAAELRETPGEFTASAFVSETVGVDNVCERAAVRAACGRLLAKKRTAGGAATALAEKRLEVQF